MYFSANDAPFPARNLLGTRTKNASVPRRGIVGGYRWIGIILINASKLSSVSVKSGFHPEARAGRAPLGKSVFSIHHAAGPRLWKTIAGSRRERRWP